MLHELLLCVAGHAGDVFVPTPSPTDLSADPVAATFAVSPNFPFLHPAERTALNRLAHLGFLFKKVENFIKNKRKAVWDQALGRRTNGRRGARDDVNQSMGMSTSSATFQNTSKLDGIDIEPSRASTANTQEQNSSPNPSLPNHIPTGLYLLALCSAIDGVLDKYRAVIVDSERKILFRLDVDTNGGRTPLAWVENQFAKYHVILAHLSKLTDLIEADPVAAHGTKLLSLLHSHTSSGHPDVRDMLFQACMVVFYKQLTVWMLYGQLEDPYCEFFVRTARLETSHSETRRAALSHTDRTRWQTQFVLDESLCPSFLPETTPQAIFFIGKAVVTIRESKKNGEDLVNGLRTRHSDAIALLMSPPPSSTSPPFHPLKFLTTVQALKRDVASILWDVVVVEQQFLKHLNALRQCFCCGEGEVWTRFLEECSRLKRQAGERLAVVTDYELNATFRKIIRATSGSGVSNPLNTSQSPAASLSQTDIHQFLDHFSFRICRGPSHLHQQSRPTGNQPFLPDNEQDLSLSQDLLGVPFTLHYSISWPLDLIFTPKDMQDYNTILSFLLRVKAVHMRLERLHTLLVRDRADRQGKTGLLGALDDGEADRRGKAAWIRRVWRVRRSMIVFWDCLWSYMQMDVLESGFQQLIAQLTRTEIVGSPTDEGSDYEEARESPLSSRRTSGEHPSLSSIGGLVGSPSPPHPAPSPTTPPPPKTTSIPPDLDTLQHLHTTHLQSLLRGCFLDAATRPVLGESIKDIWKTCELFCGVVERGMEALNPDDEGLGVTEIEETFEKQSSFLFRTLSGIQSLSPNPQTQNSASTQLARGGGARAQNGLGKLLLRWDWNKWYTLGKGGDLSAEHECSRSRVDLQGR
ncbi:gamma-tubulin complex component protein [Phlyctochytrium arcticum]|nr:gamma-tubulin complex component protein [Phlyctochytrium arcticum]